MKAYLKDKLLFGNASSAEQISYGDGTVKDALDGINSNFQSFNSGLVYVDNDTITTLSTLTIPVGVSLVTATVEYRNATATGSRMAGIAPLPNAYTNAVALSNAVGFAGGWVQINVVGIVKNDTNAPISFYVNANHTAGARVGCAASGQVIHLK